VVGVDRLERRIVAECVAVVGVLVAGGDRQRAQREHRRRRMLDAQRIAPVAHGGCGPSVVRERLCSDNRTLHEINGLRHTRQPDSSAAMNDPG
jgi:hypothetical protein